MAIFIDGMPCAICGQPLHTTDDRCSFSHFLPDWHRLYRFSDANFHKPCFEGWEDREEYEFWHNRIREIWSARPLDIDLDEIDSWTRKAAAQFEGELKEAYNKKP